MNTFMKISSGILMLVCAAMAVFDLLNMNWFWGLVMVLMFFVNLHTFQKACRD